MKKERGLSHLLAAFKYSASGLCAAFKNETAFRHELLFGVPHVIAVTLLPMPMLIRLILWGLWVQLIVVELINSSIEAVVDLVSPEYNEFAKLAKDYGSAAVFLVLSLMIACWIYVVGGIVLRGLRGGQ